MPASELCYNVKGVEVTSSTGHSASHPPSAVADGNSRTFWTSTGMYPQELTIALASVSDIKKIEIMGMGIRNMEVLTGDALTSSSNWEIIDKKRVDDADGELQRLTPDVPNNIKSGFVKIKIITGWSDIISIFKISITGTPSAIGNPYDNKNSTAAYSGTGAAGSLGSRLSGSGVDTYNGSPTHAAASGHSGRK
jgi:heat shock protein beta-11